MRLHRRKLLSEDGCQIPSHASSQSHQEVARGLTHSHFGRHVGVRGLRPGVALPFDVDSVCSSSCGGLVSNCSSEVSRKMRIVLGMQFFGLIFLVFFLYYVFTSMKNKKYRKIK